MINPDTLDYVRRVIDPELKRLRAERDYLCRQLGQRRAEQAKRQQHEHEGFLILSRMAVVALEEEQKASRFGAAAAYRLLHAAHRNGTSAA